jgi:hypothetical protein
MKCSAEEMLLFELDYGDLIRPSFEILPSHGWGQCTNRTGEYLIVYGPKHRRECSIFDTSPYVLPSEATTPDNWDCDGFLVPSDRVIQRRRGSRGGPRAVKFWNYRRFTVWSVDKGTYGCSWDNGVFEPSQINWAIPNFSYNDILSRFKCR